MHPADVVDMTRQRICLVSGGTGGHLMPALALARAMPECGFEPTLLIEGRDVERELVRRELPFVTSDELPRVQGGGLRLPLWLLRTTLRARQLLRERSVRAVISTGGRASLPVALAARGLGLPLFVLEQNAVTGRANRWLLPFAERMFVGLPGRCERHRKARFTGTPLRPGFGRVDVVAARRSLGLSADAPVVLVTGGSQGARSLNELVPDALRRVRTRVQIVHLSGLGKDAAVRHRYAAAARDMVAHVRPVAADMDRLFAAADLVICRGGGTTVAELMAVGRAAIILPYPHHKDRQQFHNARVLERVGAAIVCDEVEPDVATWTERIESLLREPSRLRAMGDAARKLRRLDAASQILAEVRNTLSGEGARGAVGGIEPVAAMRAAPSASGSDASGRGGVA